MLSMTRQVFATIVYYNGIQWTSRYNAVNSNWTVRVRCRTKTGNLADADKWKIAFPILVLELRCLSRCIAIVHIRSFSFLSNQAKYELFHLFLSYQVDERVYGTVAGYCVENSKIF